MRTRAAQLLRRVRPAFWSILLAIGLAICGYIVVLPGTRVSSISIGWMTPRAAAARLEAALDWEHRKVLLSGNGKTRDAYLASDIGIVPDLEQTVNDCRRPIWSLFRRDIPLVVTADPARLSGFAADLAAQFDVAVADARLAIGEGDRVIAVPETVGRVLDFPAFRAVLLGTCRLAAIPEIIEIPFTTVEPRVRARDLERFLPMERISSFTTHYTTENDRAFNIDLACASLQGQPVEPGGTLSFNGAVGPRTPDIGYRKAPTFVGDETVDDYGGGVCQVSTTLYVALLKAGFSVTERYSHSKPVDYVPLGFDATVTYEYLDLKMTNPGDVPCLVRVTARGGDLTADVFGRPAGGLSIEIESRVLKEFPAVVEAPQPGQPAQPVPGGGQTPPGSAAQDPAGQKKLRNGYLVETVRKYIRGGQIEKVERLGTSMYPPEKPKAQ